MKPLLIAILLIVISCKKQEPDLPKTNLPVTVESKSEITDSDKLENDVFQAIEDLKNSKPENRRKNIIQFLSFADTIDGAAAESYCNFAFEYVENNTKNFLSVLTPNDSIVIAQWAKKSADEIAILAETPEEISSLWAEINKNHIAKRQNLGPDEIQLDKLYLKELKIAIDKHKTH